MFYSQRDPRWKQVKLGTCSDSLGQSGCFVTSLAGLSGKLPTEVNDLFKKKGGYVNGCLINSSKAAELLGLEYQGKTTQKPSRACIAETNYYAKSGVPQHFFVWNPDGRIADPLSMSPDWQENVKKYPIVSYRLFFAKEEAPVKPKEEPKLEEKTLPVDPIPEKVTEPVIVSDVPSDPEPKVVPIESKTSQSSSPAVEVPGKSLWESFLQTIFNFFKRT